MLRRTMIALSPRAVAVLALLGACICWALSFPTMRAMSLAQAQQIPEASTVFITGWSLALRFLVAAVVVTAWYAWRQQLRGWTRKEVSQAIGLGVFTAAGMLLQMDALAYIEASISAFITQGYCVFLPVFFALRDRRLPRWPVALGCTLVFIGVGVLSGINLRHLTLGRGEWETLLAALIFTAQILWVERPVYAGNHMGRVCVLAFAITGTLFLPLVAVTAPSAHALIDAYSSWPLLLCIALLTLVCTLGGMVLMFTFQRGVGAIGAAVIYCTEPIFASGFAFVMPAMWSSLLGITYANEQLTTHLLIGGLLVIAANLIVLIKPAATPTQLPQ